MNICSRITGSILLLSATGLVSQPVLADSATKSAQSGVAQAEEKDYGITLGFLGVAEAWHTAGGRKTGSNVMYSPSVSLSIDAEKLLGWTGGSFYFDTFVVGGRSLALDNVPAWAPPSPLDAFFAMGTVRFYQAFYEQEFESTGTSVLAGFYDLQTQFGHTRPTELFFNRSFAMNAPLVLAGATSGYTTPSLYPTSTLGFRVKQKIGDDWTFKFGVINGLSDNPKDGWPNGLHLSSDNGAMGLAEINYEPDRRTKLMLGAWAHTGKFQKLFEFTPSFARKEVTGTGGVYAGAATRVHTIEGFRGIDVFANVGYGAPEISPVDFSANFGVTATGLFEARPGDRLGAAVNFNHVSDGYRKLNALAGGKIDEWEAAFEVTYRAPINDWLLIQPNIQYIINPSVAGNQDDALVFGLHVELTKLFRM